MMLYTTLNKLQRHDPCGPGKEKLLAYLGKTAADDEPLSLKTILESNGVEDALWCLRGVDGHATEMRLFAIWCARQVEHLDKSGASKTLNDANEAWVNEQITAAAWEAANDAARSATRGAQKIEFIKRFCTEANK